MRVYRYTYLSKDAEPIQFDWVSIEAIPERERGWFKWMLDEGSSCMASPTEVYEIIEKGELK